MSVPSLISLSIENLRGAVTPFELTFEKGKKLTIIYGENGTGKSTLSDAFDLLGNGRVGSLDTRGLGSTRKYWPSLGKSVVDVKVSLKTSSGECSALMSRSDVVVTDTALRPQVAVLRRSQILQLIEAKPSERYTAISRFVDVSGVEASESTLRKLILDKGREYEEAVTRVSENRDAIDRFWKEAGSPGASAIAWAREVVQKDQRQLEKRKESVDCLLNLWNALLAHPAKLAALADQLTAAEAAQQLVQRELIAIKDLVASDYLEVLDLLKAAQAHFHRHPNPAICPLCESGERATGLPEEVNRRIAAQGLYNQLEASTRLAAAKESAVQQARQRVDDARSAAAEAAAEFESYCNSEAIPSDLPKPTLPLPKDPMEWQAWIAALRGTHAEWKDAAETCVADTKFLRTLRASLSALASNEKHATSLETLLPHLEKTQELIETERKRFTDSILNLISTRVGELYELIHPGEGLNKIALALDAAKRASLEIATEFQGRQGTPPQAYFSDSHLDTLGLCVFIALAERETPEHKVLVLDDVLGSVDEPHVDRIIEMIYDVTSNFRHCLVTTHYGPWRHKYRWGWLKNGQCQFLELSRWSPHKGISQSRSIPESERLRALLHEASPDHQAICSKAGVILEAILDFLTQLYECHVPRRNGSNYTLGDLLPAIDSKLRKAMRVEHRQEDASGTVSYHARQLEPHLNELMRIAQVRNVTGCHFNALSFDMLDSDAITFGTEVLALADALIDHDIGWPRNGKSGSYWATAGDTRRLHPLKKPS